MAPVALLEFRSSTGQRRRGWRRAVEGVGAISAGYRRVDSMI